MRAVRHAANERWLTVNDYDPVIDVSKIAEDLMESEKRTTLGAEANLMLPWKHLFLEDRRSAAPEVLVSCGTTYTIPEPYRNYAIAEDYGIKLLQHLGADLGNDARIFKFLQPPPPAYHFVFWRFVCIQPHRLVDIGMGLLYLDETGHLINIHPIGADPEGVLSIHLIGRTRKGEDKHKIGLLEELIDHMALIAGFSVQLCHCKNVTLQAEELSHKLVRSWKKQNKPIIQYKTLVIEPTTRRKTLDDLSSSNHKGISLHLQRGHFKDYKEGEGLFGKLHGTWWWQPHARGDDKVGTVHKQYQLNNKKEEK